MEVFLAVLLVGAVASIAGAFTLEAVRIVIIPPLVKGIVRLEVMTAKALKSIKRRLI